MTVASGTEECLFTVFFMVGVGGGGIILNAC